METLRVEANFLIAVWTELTVEERRLFTGAAEARKKARASQSRFQVGAMILSNFGECFSGCNVEDVAHSGCLHAEEGALANMVVNGKPGSLVETVAVVLGPHDTIISLPPILTNLPISPEQIKETPCGHCRTILSQYCLPNARALCLLPNGKIRHKVHKRVPKMSFFC